MFWRAECPIRPGEQQWIDESLDALVERFGSVRLRGPVIEPTDEWFPGAYEGSRDDVRAVFLRLCAHMGVDPADVDLIHDEGHESGLSGVVPLTTSWKGAAGHHRMVDGRSVIGVNDSQARRPMALVATVAHELGHVELHATGDFTPDGEPLTDLFTVYSGAGIFTANAALDQTRETRGEYSYTSTTRLGYLTEPMFGYALARYAWLRGEPGPRWARYLDTNPRTFMKRGLRYLNA